MFRRPMIPATLLLLALAFAALPAAATEVHMERDCGDVFTFLGTVNGARFSPLLPGELGTVVLEGVISDPWVGRRGLPSFATWEITVEPEGGAHPVRRFTGTAPIAPHEEVNVSVAWDGRDDRGHLLPEGTYYARFAARRVVEADVNEDWQADLFGSRASRFVVSREELTELAAAWEDSPFTDGIRFVLDHSLDEAAAMSHRWDPARPALLRSEYEVTAKVNAPHEPIPFNFYYGNPHSHSTRSDGGGSACATDCATSTGRADGAYPDDLYTIAKTPDNGCPTQGGGLDFLMIAEHNHLFNDATPNDGRAPATGPGPGGQYAQGRAYADAATTSTFVGIYGMEWGTITGCNHVDVYDSPNLWGWEAGWYDTLTAQCAYTGPTGLWAIAAQPANVSPATGLPHLVLNHPYSSEPASFDSYAKDAFSDAAVRGMAVVSGSATNCATNYPGGGTAETGGFKDRFVVLLDRGWKLAPEGHQDNHGDNVGTHSQVRTVFLAEQLTRECLLKAQYNRRAYATQDRDGQLVFTAAATSNAVVHQMGEEMGGSGGVNFHASWWDNSRDEITTYRILRGRVGGGCTSIANFTAANATCKELATGTIGVPPGDGDAIFDPGENLTINVSDTAVSGTFYYFVEIVIQNTANAPLPDDPYTRHTVSAPIWVNYGIADAGTTPARCGCLTFPSAAPSATPTFGCGTVNSQLQANASGGTPGYTYQWSPATGLSSTSIANPVATVSSTTTYSVIVTDSTNCRSNTQTVTVTASNPVTAPSAFTNPICTGGSTALAANASGGVAPYTYLWSPSTGLDDPTSATPIASPASTTGYTVVATDSLGCPSPAGPITITVNAGTPPAEPTNVAATSALPTQAVVSWDNVIASGNYRIYRSSSGCTSFALVQTQARVAGSRNSWTDSGVVAGTTYCYRVTAADSNCEGAPIGCNAAACITPQAVPEVSPGGAPQQLRLSRTTTGTELRFEDRGASYRYHLYSAADEASMDAGAYAAKFCDLDSNPAGSWGTGAGFFTFTFSDPATVPSGNLVVVAESGWVEGSYGTKSNGTPRAHDADLRAAVQTGCPAEVAPSAIGQIVINELHADPHGSEGDANGDGIVDFRNDEFLEIVNVTANTLVLDGVTITDSVDTLPAIPGIRHTFPAASYVLPCQAVVVFGGGTPTGTFGGAVVQTATTGELNVSNAGETFTLALGATPLGSATYGTEGANDQSLVRNPEGNGAATFFQHRLFGTPRFSPGTKIGGASACWSASEPALPTCTLTFPGAGVWAGAIDVLFDLSDPDTASLSVTFEYSTDAVNWFPATAGAGSPLLNPATGVTPGTGKSFRWNSAVDMPGIENASFRITVSDGVAAPSVCSADFRVDNAGGITSPRIGEIVLNEIHGDPDAAAGDANGDGIINSTDDEFVEIVNVSSRSVALDGIVVRDAVGTRHVFPEGTTLPACKAAVVFGGGTPTGTFGGAVVQVASTGALGINNTGDTISVVLGSGVYSSHSFGAEIGNNNSLNRTQEGVSGAGWVQHVTLNPARLFSPGTKFDGSTNCWIVTNPACTTGLIISEYVEGSGNNRAIEIFNGTGASIDLAAAPAYNLAIYANGSLTATTTINLTGVLADRDNWVVCHNLASAGIKAVADQITSTLQFDGNDVVALRKGAVLVDVIGQIGNNPGVAGWGTDPTNTTDNTIRRKATVTAGDTNGGDAFNPATEWDGYAVDDISDLGIKTCPAPPTCQGHLVISQVYGGGGNTGATWRNDFIELFNCTTSPISVNGWSVQYASAAGTTWTVDTLANTSVPARSYFLVQEASGGAIGTLLPTPDDSGTLNMSGTAGKVALVNSVTALSGTNPTDASIVDKVGYGSANGYEGLGPTPGLTNTTAAFRDQDGCQDTNDNANDFATATPAPRNTASPIKICP